MKKATAFIAAAALIASASAQAQTRIPGAAIFEIYAPSADIQAPLPGPEAALFSGPLPLLDFKETDIAKIAPLENWQTAARYRATFFWANKSDAIVAFAPVIDMSRNGRECHARMSLADQIVYDGRPLRYAPANIATQKINLKAGDYKIELTVACRIIGETRLENEALEIYIDKSGGHTQKLDVSEIVAEQTAEQQIASARVIRFGKSAEKPQLTDGIEPGFVVSFRSMSTKNIDDELKRTAIATRVMRTNDIAIARVPEMRDRMRPLLLLDTNLTVSETQIGKTKIAIIGLMPPTSSPSGNNCTIAGWLVGAAIENTVAVATWKSNLYGGASLIGHFDLDLKQPGAYALTVMIACRTSSADTPDIAVRPMIKRPGEKRIRAAEPTDFVIKKGA